MICVQYKYLEALVIGLLLDFIVLTPPRSPTQPFNVTYTMPFATPPPEDHSAASIPMDDNYPAPLRLGDLYESSIADPDPQDVTALAHVDTYKIVKETSITGLFDSVGYSYTA